MKYLIKTIKFFERRQLRMLFEKCGDMSDFYHEKADVYRKKNDINSMNFNEGMSAAYSDMRDYIYDKMVKELKNE